MTTSRPKTVDVVAGTAVLALGLRVLYLFVRYILGSTSTERFHVESWALIFVATGLMVRVARSRRPEQRPTTWIEASFWTWLIFCGLAVALYWPALSVGFLSDDFVLVTYASRWSIGPVTASLFRPLPLLLWALLLHLQTQVKDVISRSCPVRPSRDSSSSPHAEPSFICSLGKRPLASETWSKPQRLACR